MSQTKISKVLEENILCMDRFFKDCGDTVKRKFPIGEVEKVNLYVMYIDMLTDRETIEHVIISRLMINSKIVSKEDGNLKENIFNTLKDGGITTADLKEVKNIEEINDGLLSGDTILFVDGFDKAILISTKGWPSRGVPTADTEVVVQGSKESFSEVFRINTTLIRRRIRDTNLKVMQMRVGRRSETDVALMYLDDIVRPDVLSETIERMKNIDIDAILDVGYIEQLIEDDWLSPFPQAQVTERPDKASAAILEGRIVIIVDNSPFVLIVPCTLNAFFQSSEDYYQRFQISSFVRIIRYVAAIIAICLPGAYLATVVYHPSMIPMLLIFKMAAANQSVPFPAVIEILIMELAFELLREAGIRLPSAVGSTIGIVGGLIIGQAAVDAGLVSPIVVIIVAITGICSFAIPHVSLVTGFRLMKFVIIFTSAILGLFGFWLGVIAILLHLVTLKSFGIPYMFPFTSGDINDYTDFKDTIVRFPLFSMKKRPIFANPKYKRRIANYGQKREKE